MLVSKPHLGPQHHTLQITWCLLQPPLWGGILRNRAYRRRPCGYLKDLRTSSVVSCGSCCQGRPKRVHETNTICRWISRNLFASPKDNPGASWRSHDNWVICANSAVRTWIQQNTEHYKRSSFHNIAKFVCCNYCDKQTHSQYQSISRSMLRKDARLNVSSKRQPVNWSTTELQVLVQFKKAQVPAQTFIYTVHSRTCVLPSTRKK